MNELKGRRIFIVEDDVLNMAVYSVTLKRGGAEVIQDPWHANTISKLIQNLPIDIVLMDLMLRYKVSGYDIFDQLQAYPALNGIPVIAVSASDPSIEIPKARAKGFAGFIGKPIDPVQFPIQIAACINGEPIWHYQQDSLESI
ncbi:MAG: response regulator [Anaerolineae bacterium]|nr:response regulator [Anaerolineae bacterium]